MKTLQEWLEEQKKVCEEAKKDTRRGTYTGPAAMTRLIINAATEYEKALRIIEAIVGFADTVMDKPDRDCIRQITSEILNK